MIVVKKHVAFLTNFHANNFKDILFHVSSIGLFVSRTCFLSSIVYLEI